MNNTHLLLYEITCKHVYEIGKTQRFKCFFERTKRFKKTLKKIKRFIFLSKSLDP